MYDRIQAAFAQGKAFIPFLTCGDPDLETTAATVRAMAANGADLIELGIPFSDPTAEGPVIQEANLRALRGGVTTDQVFALVQDLRRDVTVPLVFMTYANVVFTYGAEAFFARCQSVGVDGIILPDLPYEEKGEFQAACRKHGVALISMIAPTSAGRIAKIAREAEGFLYLVSSLGVTGARQAITTITHLYEVIDSLILQLVDASNEIVDVLDIPDPLETVDEDLLDDLLECGANPDGLRLLLAVEDEADEE